jgi:hypothetical protein
VLLSSLSEFGKAMSAGMSAGEVSDVETGGNGRGWADGQAGTYPAANDICGIDLGLVFCPIF